MEGEKVILHGSYVNVHAPVVIRNYQGLGVHLLLLWSRRRGYFAELTETVVVKAACVQDHLADVLAGSPVVIVPCGHVDLAVQLRRPEHNC
jgi:hypothetical protein